MIKVKRDRGKIFQLNFHSCLFSLFLFTLPVVEPKTWAIFFSPPIHVPSLSSLCLIPLVLIPTALGSLRRVSLS